MAASSCKNCMYCKKKETKDGVLYYCNQCGMVAPDGLLPTGCERWRRNDSGSEYIYQNDREQVDEIFDLYAEEKING